MKLKPLIQISRVMTAQSRLRETVASLEQKHKACKGHNGGCVRGVPTSAGDGDVRV